MIRFYNTLFLILFVFFNCAAQVDTEFWFAPPEITSGHGDLPIILRVSAQAEPATVQVFQPARENTLLASFTIPANTTEVIDLSTSRSYLETFIPNTVMSTGLHIISSAPVTAYYEEASFFNAEIFVLKGKNALGKKFILPAQDRFDNSGEYRPIPYFSFDVVATKDNTIVKVWPTSPLEGHESDSVITVRLNKGETYSFKKKGLSALDNPVGTVIESSQPITITIKDDSVINGGCRDLLGDQLVPVEVAGKEYIVLKGFLNTPEFFFITATEDNTQVFMQGISAPVSTLNAGQSDRFEITQPSTYIASNKNIYVIQVTGFGCELAMAVLPPITCTGSKQIGFTRSTEEFFGMNVLVRKEGIFYFKLNGDQSLVPPHMFRAVAGTNDKWYAAQLSFSETQVAVDMSSLIENERYSFQAGIINGNASTSSRFGYFSSFSTLFIGDDFDICDGSTAIIDAGPGKESYLWSTGATTQSIDVDHTGDYWVRVTREECVLYDTVHVNVRAGKVDLGPDVSICIDEVAKIDGKENFKWLWSDGSTKQFLETKELGTYWVSVSDNIGCQASDTIVVGRETYSFDIDVGIELKFVSVDTANEQSINLAWSVSEKERKEINRVFIYKRPLAGPKWELIARLPANVNTFQDVSENTTDDIVYEYFVSLADPCGQEQRYSDYHNTIRLAGFGDEPANTISLNWNYYRDWKNGVKRYEVWRKLEDDKTYSFFRELNADAENLSAAVATDAFHHQYIIRAMESGGDSESWSNSIELEFEHPVFVPNVFTPNDDSYNQYFEITNIGLYKNSKLIVFDRWGMTIFEANGYQNAWDGNAVSSGIYYYLLYLNRNDLKPLKGPLSIIK